MSIYGLTSFQPDAMVAPMENTAERNDLDAREAAGMYDETPAAAPECAHEFTSERSGSPERSGRCATYMVCDDCSESLGQTGWDSVL